MIGSNTFGPVARCESAGRGRAHPYWERRHLAGAQVYSNFREHLPVRPLSRLFPYKESGLAFGRGTASFIAQVWRNSLIPSRR